MSEKIEGGAGPALAAHSKDASKPHTSVANEAADTVSGLAGQMREAVGHAASSVSEAANAAGETVSRQTSRAADQAAEFVREQPLVALLATGAICFMLGTLISRR